MRPQSAKQKGRLLQQKFRQMLVDLLGLDEEDLESRPMGSQGEDIIMGKQSREVFPYSIECKNQEALNVWSKVLVVLDAEHFVKLHLDSDSTG